MRLLWLPTVLRSAGLTVHEVSGWKTRGDNSYGPVRGITCHHTAGSKSSTDSGEIRTLLNGSSSAPPPIAQLYLSRTGDWHVVASGLCYHNLVGWGGPNKGYGNDAILGIEAQHSGEGEEWTSLQYDSYVRGVAALVRHKADGYNVTVGRVAGHKEHQPGAKTDPSFNMDKFRERVTAQIKALSAPARGNNMSEATDTAAAVWANGGAQQLLYRAEGVVSLRNPVALPGGRTETNALAVTLARMEATINAIAAKVDLSPAELQQVRDAAAEGAEAGAGEAIVDATDDLVDAIVAALQDTDPDDPGAVESAVRGVVAPGSADSAA